MLTAPREGGVIGSFEINNHQEQHRPQESLCLAKRQLKDKSKFQGRLVRVAGELLLPASCLPDGSAFQAPVASVEIHRVMSPRCTRARSYSAQLLTRYFVLYLRCTLDFIPESWPNSPSVTNWPSVDHLRPENHAPTPFAISSVHVASVPPVA